MTWITSWFDALSCCSPVKLRPHQSGPADILDVPLIFFSAFERLRPDPQDEMQRIGDIIRLYEPGPYSALEPIMHVGFLIHVLCRAPLIPCYLNGNPTPTAPHGLKGLISYIMAAQIVVREVVTEAGCMK